MTDTDPTKQPATTQHSNNVVPLQAQPAEKRPSEKVISFVKRHPVLTVAGAVAAGVAASALLPRKTSRKVVDKAFGMAEAASAATMMFGRRAEDKAHAVGSDARKQAAVLGEKAEKAGHVTALRLEKYGLAAMAAASALGRSAAKRASKLGDAAAEKATRIGDAASEKSHEIAAATEDLKRRVKH
ncbi:hypothetical protein [Novosphingobium malaysiense]|uniref:Uncharacterized protein n=1 Tax=Novosphingobium malaysiense TaxID=1348853 RepID=A0A0B1ZL34_9SPHN|nr:hypothetical protein [Novosphingobium malaysiense]KHK91266.1 hypothetical protein LK12_10275 [Novosphingobium malaysiense]